jgi:hypothetical protein
VEAIPSSAASPSQAAAAANNGPGPGPEYIRPELISGGNSPKSSTKPLRQEARIAWAGSAGNTDIGPQRCRGLLSDRQAPVVDRSTDVDVRNAVCGH